MAAVFLRDPTGERYRSPADSRVNYYLEEHSQAVVLGRVSRQKAGDGSDSVYLKNADLCISHDSNELKKGETYPLGSLRVFFSKEKEQPELTSGMDVVIRGELYPVEGRRNPGEFDSRTYYACQGIYFLMQGERVVAKGPVREPLLALREGVKDRVSSFFGQEAGVEGGIFCAMLLGDGEIQTDAKAFYQMGGILHLFAISGLHITLIGMGIFSLLLRLGAGLRGSAALSGAFVLFYGFFTGGSPSALRAVCMFLLLLLARALGRCYDTLTALSLAAALLVWENPAYLWYSGFLLSFGAVLGLTLSGIFFPGDDQGKLRQAVKASLAVQAVTLPMVFTFFGDVSLIGILLNLFVLPTAGGVLLSGFAGAAAGMLFPALGGVLLLPGRGLLKLYLGLARAGAAFPYAMWAGGEPKPWQVLGYYGLLLCFALLWKKRGHLRRAACLGLVLAALILIGWKDRCHLVITALDVGQGDAIFWELPGGGAFLADGGSTSQSQVGKYQLLPFIRSRGFRQLEGIFVSHMDEDHLSGVRELLTAQRDHTAALRTKRLFLPDWAFEHPVYQELSALAGEAGVEVRILKRGDSLRFGQAEVRVLHPGGWSDPEDLNGGSLVLELHYKEFRGLFTGDLGIPQEAGLIPDLSDCTFLKAAHHGSKNSTSEEFLAAVRPEFAFISCGDSNRYGHPAPELLLRLEEADCKAYLTKDSGALQLVTDGVRAAVKTYRQPSGRGALPG